MIVGVYNFFLCGYEFQNYMDDFSCIEYASAQRSQEPESPKDNFIGPQEGFHFVLTSKYKSKIT